MTGTLAQWGARISDVCRDWWDGMAGAMIRCMERQWWNLGRPALVGFFVGLLVTAGLAYVAPHMHSSGKAAPRGP
jgi:hypothetical protein